MRLALLSAAALSLANCAPALPTETEALEKVTVFTNGTIYTGLGDAAGVPQTVTGVVVGADGRIIATIPPMSADWSEEEVNVIDLGGAFMFPGFTDAHVHLSGVGERELTLNLEGTAAVSELVARVKSELEGKPESSVLVGRGWIETGWPEGRMPMASDLDPVTGAHKVILGRSDGHALVANSAALAASGITDETPDPPGGRIERDASGKATGILIDAAMGLVQPLIAEPDDAAVSLALETGAKLYASRGWTGGHNMSVTAREAPLMAALDGEGRLPLRLYNAFDASAFEIAESRLNETDTIANRAVKLYMDGALGSRGAQLLQPYSDRPDTSGLSLLDDDALAAFMARAKAANVQLAIHAIGDLANRRILEAYETGGYDKSLRWRIEHAQVIHPDDLARVASGGLIASMQPSHAIGDLFFAPARLGMDRLRGAYAWATLLDLGTVIAGGSDAPVEVGSPTIEFYAAVARKDLKGFSGEGWHPEEAVSRARALALFTTGPAFASFREADLGTIEPGKLADFTVFDRDLMTIPEGDILKAEPVMTVIGGEVVWRR
ncbi:amidohydrolase [Hyphomonas sp.]|jgi:predicted amidohydrolase YtcJ|uniref:amidohydrolase n=1 Tax=Hyphomonas sp. TaxID=87 RepID=UPI0025C2D5CB|nr:amidohydrolase [Hyphomonas sp.]